MPITPYVNAKLAAIGREMAKQDNQGTACPVWLVYRAKEDRFPRVFLTEKAALEYLAGKKAQLGNSFTGYVQVGSAQDNLEMMALMLACIEAAGVGGDRIANAYFDAIRS